MTVTAIHKDSTRFAMLLTAEFAASPERVWQLWQDPRQLERWWGPPTYPATFTSHNLRPGGRVEYHMTGPAGDQPHGYWDVVEVDPPHRLVLNDGFAHADGSVDSSIPMMTMRVTIEAIGEGKTQMQLETEFANRKAMEEMLARGMEVGLREAVGQIDDILAETVAAPR